MNLEQSRAWATVARRALGRLSLCLLAWAHGHVRVHGAAALAPDAEARTFQLADPALAVELVAAEPDVVSPVAIAWDADGRLYVAEMRDYPNAGGGGTIRRLTDRDGDGRYETAVVFAEGLPFPSSVLPWRDGVLVTAAPDLWFLADRDGDGRADERRVLWTGFAAGNQQLRANGLTWGFDGWVYGANGRSDGQVRRAGATNLVSLRGRDFRFRPETGEFETLAGRSQFGLGLDAWGGRYLSWNTIPLRHEVFPDRYLAVPGAAAGREVLADLLPADDTGEVFPLSPPPRVFNNESSSHFNALAGLTIYRGLNLGPEYAGNAFVGETLRNLVHRRRLEPAGATFVARRAEAGREFLRASDPWFHPVNFAHGPDGMLYVVDFYREFVEHPDFVPREMRDREPWQRGREHGRIWRVVRRGRIEPGPGRGLAPEPGLRSLGPTGWVRELENTKGWRRETAQRLLRELDPAQTWPADELRAVARRSPSVAGRFLAGELLASRGRLEAGFVLDALRDGEPAIRARALAWALNLEAPYPPALASAVIAAANDGDARVRLWAALALRNVGDETAREGALRTLLEKNEDRWIRLAAVSSSTRLSSAEAARWLAVPGRLLRPAPVIVGADPDRQKVIERLTPALRVAGNRTNGAATFGRLCLACHYLQGHGARVGPDLSGIASRPVEALLIDLLDPSRQVAPEYAAYEIALTDGETVTGLFASEMETRITIRRPGGADENLPRSRIRGLKATGKSLMPDGLETGWSTQDLADLLAFLRQPDGQLLPGEGGTKR